MHALRGLEQINPLSVSLRPFVRLRRQARGFAGYIYRVDASVVTVNLEAMNFFHLKSDP